MSESVFFIPAGGEGQRLRPLTNSAPKPLLPVARAADGSYERVIDTPVAIARKLDARSVVTGCYRGDLITEHFRGQHQVETALDTEIVHIGGSMIQHQDLLFHDAPGFVVMIPGDHFVPLAAVARLVQRLKTAGADVALLGTWQHAYHETYPVTDLHHSECRTSLTYAPESRRPTQLIASLGTYAFDAAWLQRRLAHAPRDDTGHCDLTTDVVFGKDQVKPPHIVFEPLYSEEYWQDVGTIRRLYDHIRFLHPPAARDSQGNIDLAGSMGVDDVSESVIYPGATPPSSPQTRSFIARNFIESYTD